MAKKNMSSSIDYVSSIEDDFDEEELQSITGGIKDQVDNEGKVSEKPELTPVENSVPAEMEQDVPSDNEKRSKAGDGKDSHNKEKRKAKDSSLDDAKTANDKFIQLRVRIPEKDDILLRFCSSLCKKSRNEYILDLIRDSFKDVLSKNGLENLLKGNSR